MDIQKTLEDFKADMELRGFSARSVNVYIGAVSLYLKYCSETAQSSGEESFRSYLIQLLREKKLAKATANLYNSAIRFYLGSAEKCETARETALKHKHSHKNHIIMCNSCRNMI